MNTRRTAIFVQLEEILQFDLQEEMNGVHIDDDPLTCCPFGRR